MSETAWDKAFTQGSKSMQDRLKKVHAKNPKFQSWLQKSGHGAGQSVKQASKEVRATERAKKLAQQSLKAYGATKGQRMGGEDGSGETLRDTIAPLTRDQHSKVQAAQRAAKTAAKPAKLAKPTAPKKPLTKDQRIAAIAAAARKAKTKHDVPTMDVEDDHDDLRDLHQSLHIRRGYNEEMEKVDEIVGVLAAMDKADKARYKPQVGDKIRTRMGGQIPGTVTKVTDTSVHFTHPEGKKYKTSVNNVMREEVELEEADMSNKEKKKEYVRQVGLKAMKQGKVDPARGHSPQRFGREILKGAAADRAVRKAMEKEMTRMGEEVVAEGKMKDIDTEHKETARLAAREKEPPFTPDKNKVRRGTGGPMSQAKWLAKQAMMKAMKKEELKQIEEGDLSIRHLYNKWADHYTSDKGNSAKRADAVEKAINKVHGPKVMGHLKKAINANLRGDMDQEENHFERAKTAAEKSGSDRIGATVGRDRSKFRKEEVELIEQDDTMEKKEMAQTQLHFMQYAAKEILEFIAMGGQIEEWYQNKLSKVHSDMEGLHSYIEGEKRRTGMVREESEEVEQIEEALDPVGKEDKDIDNDGDSDKTDVYLATKRKAIGKAIKDRLAKKMGK